MCICICIYMYIYIYNCSQSLGLDFVWSCVEPGVRLDPCGSIPTQWYSLYKYKDVNMSLIHSSTSATSLFLLAAALMLKINFLRLLKDHFKNYCKKRAPESWHGLNIHSNSHALSSAFILLSIYTTSSKKSSLCSLSCEIKSECNMWSCLC